MAQKAIDMLQLKQVQRLHQDGVSIKEIVRLTGISRKTVRKYLRKLQAVIVPQEQGDLSAKELAQQVYNRDETSIGSRRFSALLDHFEQAIGELQKTGVTRQILWVEYLQSNPDGYRYSQYCYLFRKYLKDTDPAFHWEYKPGELSQMDFAGRKLSYVDKHTGEVIYCEVFVGVLPFSGLIFCLAVRSQRQADFVLCTNQMVKYTAGVTLTYVVDNFRTAVKRADKNEPVFTDLCYQLSDYYQTTFSATRPAHPRDKAMVEKAVNIVYTHIYAPMRNQIFHSLEELNTHIRIHLDKLNKKPYKNRPESRWDIFMRLEYPLLKPLPAEPFRVKKCKTVTVQRNYAIELPDNGHSYTVPYTYVGRKVQVYFTQRTVEVFLNLECIAFHVRRSDEPRFNRLEAHMPPHHQHMAAMQGWTVEGLLQRSEQVGPYTRQAADRILHSSIYPEQNFKACHALIMLQKTYTRERLEAACTRAAYVPRPTLKMIRAILKAGLDGQPLLFDQDAPPLPVHQNIRGPEQYT
ncbi:MAG: IS21 family transposase [Bacteroidota bacterium]|nr:IS21 family transposase [Bacteroidota bacterium]